VPTPALKDRAGRAQRVAQAGLLVNTGLALAKLLAGILGHSYALIADAIESTADVFSSLIVWGGLEISVREADEEFPFGYGKADALAAAVVALMLLGAGAGIAVQAVREILVPHHAPAPFTLAVLLAAVAIKETLFRRVRRVGGEVGSRAVEADAWHHRSDALTSAAAAVGIGVALAGSPRFAPADDWAALVAAGVIGWNGAVTLRRAALDLLDRAAPEPVRDRVEAAALSVPGALAVEKLAVRRSGLGLFVDIHVEAEASLPLRDAHVLSGMVKSAIRAALPEVIGVLVHMEPHRSTEAAS
jgi:cation diffusion facilitator family transporter